MNMCKETGIKDNRTCMKLTGHVTNITGQTIDMITNIQREFQSSDSLSRNFNVFYSIMDIGVVATIRAAKRKRFRTNVRF